MTTGEPSGVPHAGQNASSSATARPHSRQRRSSGGGTGPCPTAIAFGVFLGLMELIPYIGPVLGALPPVLVALFNDPISALWVALLFVGLQQLEGHVVAPQIFSHSLRINPLLVIFALLVGQQIYGIVGAIVALPTIAVIRETVIYLHRHLELEPWDRTPKPLL